jgi:hypothetical protein
MFMFTYLISIFNNFFLGNVPAVTCGKCGGVGKTCSFYGPMLDILSKILLLGSAIFTSVIAFLCKLSGIYNDEINQSTENICMQPEFTPFVNISEIINGSNQIDTSKTLSGFIKFETSKVMIGDDSNQIFFSPKDSDCLVRPKGGYNLMQPAEGKTTYYAFSLCDFSEKIDLAFNDNITMRNIINLAGMTKISDGNPNVFFKLFCSKISINKSDVHIIHDQEYTHITAHGNSSTIFFSITPQDSGFTSDYVNLTTLGEFSTIQKSLEN